MLEGIDPKEYEKINNQLKKAGMPEEPELGQEVPNDVNSATGVLLELVPEIKESLEKFKLLKHKLQEDILEDIKKQRIEGMPVSDILDRFEVLVKHAEYMESMSASDSDKEHKPEDVLSEEEKREQDEQNKELDKLIREMELVIKRENHIPERSTH